MKRRKDLGQQEEWLDGREEAGVVVARFETGDRVVDRAGDAEDQRALVRLERRGDHGVASVGRDEGPRERRARRLAGAAEVAAGEERADEPVVRAQFAEMRNGLQRKGAEVVGEGDGDLRALIERHQLRRDAMLRPSLGRTARGDEKISEHRARRRRAGILFQRLAQRLLRGGPVGVEAEGELRAQLQRTDGANLAQRRARLVEPFPNAPLDDDRSALQRKRRAEDLQRPLGIAIRQRHARVDDFRGRPALRRRGPVSGNAAQDRPRERRNFARGDEEGFVRDDLLGHDVDEVEGDVDARAGRGHGAKGDAAHVERPPDLLGRQVALRVRPHELRTRHAQARRARQRRGELLAQHVGQYGGTHAVAAGARHHDQGVERKRHAVINRGAAQRPHARAVKIV